ncbi:MAG: hypothetical protein ACOCWO_01180 [Candidatus Muiribacteriaceae bacterium]
MKSSLLKIIQHFFVEPYNFYAHRGVEKSEFLIVLHFNQSFCDYFPVVWDICYKPLLRLMISEKDITFNVNFSESFLTGAGSVRGGQSLIRKSIHAENINIIRSSRAQNIPGILERNIEHELIPGADSENALFWLPERTYNHDILRTIRDKGYEYVLLEKIDIPLKCRGLKMLPDQIETRHEFNHYILNGYSYYRLLNHIKAQPLTVYAEDAEAIGLWSYERGMNPSTALKRFRRLLKQIKKTPSITTITPSEFSGRYIESGDFSFFNSSLYTASWIEDSFRGKINQFYETGFRDFNEFIASPKITMFKKRIESLYRRIKTGELPEFMEKELMNMLVLHMYEFGCPGVGFEDRYLWAGLDRIHKYLIPFESEISDTVTISQGTKARRDIFLIPCDNRFYYFDHFAQLVAYIDPDNEIFRHNESKIYLDLYFDEKYPCISFMSCLYKPHEIDIHGNTITFSNKYRKAVYTLSGEDIEYTIYNLCDKPIPFNTPEGVIYIAEKLIGIVTLSEDA